MTQETNFYRIFLYIALASALFIAYGSLLPFDFHARSLDEIRQTIVNRSAASGFISLTDRTVNVLIAMPFGFFAFGALARTHRSVRNLLAGLGIVIFSVLLAAAVEFLQLYLPTRSASYGDIVAQGLGTCVGIFLWGVFGRFVMMIYKGLFAGQPVEPPVKPLLLTFARLGALPYLLVLLGLNGWLSSGWLSINEAANNIGDQHFMPLYYHYSASIFRSLYSVAVVLIEYAPIGLLYWFGSRPPRRIFKATIIGGSVGLAVECGKLFLINRHPDSTNVLFAAFSSGVTYALWPRVAYPQHRDLDRPISNRTRDDLAPRPRADVSPLRMIGMRIISVAIFFATFAALLRYPLGAVWLAAGITFYSLALLRFPALWLIVIPALLPCFDLAPWTGWFFLDEFDLFVLATIAVGLWLSAAQEARVNIPWFLKILLVGFAASLLISLLIGLLPLQPLDANSFANYYSHYNALRSAKGFFAILGLLPLLFYNLSDGIDVPRRLASGMLIGLVTVVAAGLWERAVFPGLFDFARNYRISALFSSMHTGDAPIETYLVAVLPFAIAWAHYRKSFSSYAVALMSFVLATHVLFVTYSRGGYFAYFVVLAVLITGAVLIRGAQSQASKHTFMFVLMLSIFIGSVTSVFVLEGSFPRSRLAQTNIDMVTRLGHWRNVLNMMEPDWRTTIFGMGLGRYPETDLKKNWTVRMPSSYSYITENGNQFLRISSGAPTYLEQIVDIQPGSPYRISLDLRGAPLPGTLNVMICQRTFFRSYNCKDSGVWSSGSQQNWTHREASIDSGSLGSGSWFFRRTVKFILENTSAGTAVDVDNVKLIDGNGVELLGNGDFSQGHDRWFYSSSDHLHWHIKNIWVQVLFEQGGLGIIIFLLFGVFTLASLSKAALSGDFIYTAILASVTGFLCVGLFGSPLDAPRLAFLFYLLTIAGTVCANAPVIASAPATIQSRYAEDPEILAPDFAIDHRGARDAVEQKDRSAHHASISIWETSRLSTLMIQVLGGVFTFVAGAWLVMHSPFVPYNVRDLLHPVHPILSLIVFALFLYWSVGFPVLIGYLMTQSRSAAWSYPILLTLHSVAAWFILTYSVSFDRIHKIVGSPVLHWHWYWEPAGRFVALFTAFSLSMTASTLLVLAFIYRRRSPAAFFSWLITAAALSPLLYWIVVTKAATDNLVELMAGGGTPVAAFLLSLFVVLVFFGGSCLAGQFHSIRSAVRWLALLAFLISIPLAYLALAYGTESAFEKYGKVISGLQFILSRDREHYAQGLELGLRYLVFHAGLVGAILLVQLPVLSWLFPAPNPSQTH
jgi:VanZ family protein